MSDQAFLDETRRRLAREQDRVAGRVGMLTGRGWDVLPSEHALERLVTHGHFPRYAAELDFGPREIAGHLRDSARTSARRIARLRDGERPTFEELATTDPGVLADYRNADPADLVDQLDEAHQDLRSVLDTVRPAELDNIAVHETEGEITLREILEFLPGHAADHADQLEAVTAESIS